MAPEPRVAICHYWLVNSRGGEAVLDALLDIYPQADIFTHVLDERAVSARITSRVKRCSFIAKLPFARRYYQLYLPLMPLALKLLNLSDYDLIISLESGPAKGVTTPQGATHICYCFSPMRYLWDQTDVYLRNMGPIKALLFRLILPAMRHWDVRSAQYPDEVVAISHFVRDRIRQYWQRSSEIVHPPVDTERFFPADSDVSSYLYLGQLVPYKRPDLLIDAFNASGRELIIAGEGELLDTLRRRAADNITILGRVSDAEAEQMMQRCRALVFPGIEDFGIVPLEAMACGRPVIAYGEGGVLDTVVEGKTGMFFYRQDAHTLNQVLDRFEQLEQEFDSQLIAQHARTFSRSRFVREFAGLVNSRRQHQGAALAAVAQ